MYGTRSGVGNYISWPICGGPQQIQQTRQFVGLSGLGDCGCGCGGRCGKGLGYFDSGWDISGWSYLEWGTVLVVAYMVISTVTTTQRGYRKVRKRVRRMRA